MKPLEGMIWGGPEDSRLDYLDQFSALEIGELSYWQWVEHFREKNMRLANLREIFSLVKRGQLPEIYGKLELPLATGTATYYTLDFKQITIVHEYSQGVEKSGRYENPDTVISLDGMLDDKLTNPNRRRIYSFLFDPDKQPDEITSVLRKIYPHGKIDFEFEILNTNDGLHKRFVSLKKNGAICLTNFRGDIKPSMAIGVLE